MRLDDPFREPVAYVSLREDTPVFDREGRRVGLVELILADEAMDIFRGLIVHTVPLPGRHLDADANQIAELRERVWCCASAGGPPRTPGPADFVVVRVRGGVRYQPRRGVRWTSWSLRVDCILEGTGY